MFVIANDGARVLLYKAYNYVYNGISLSLNQIKYVHDQVGDTITYRVQRKTVCYLLIKIII